jgi:hypothetical protein
MKQTRTDMKITKIYYGISDSCRCGCNGTYYYPEHKDFNYWVGEFTRLRDEQPDHYVSETVKTRIEEVTANEHLGTVLCAYREKGHSNSFMNNLTFLKQ